LIYDAECRFCRRWVARLKRWDRRDRIFLLPLQDPAAPDLAGLPREALRQAAHLVREDGAVCTGAWAAREVLAYLPAGWLVRIVARVPGVMALADLAYRRVARRFGPVRG
jgi:predicted DCC family thiol-disulfide oxidoreductase YuxK